MSFILPDRELFDRGVIITTEHDEYLQIELEGLYQLSEDKMLCEGITIVPCIYRKILSCRNGIARAINLAGNMVYIRLADGDVFFDSETPFIAELCDDFDNSGTAKISCLVEGRFLVQGFINEQGEMFLNGYNVSS